MNKVFLISDKILDTRVIIDKIRSEHGEFDVLGFDNSFHEAVIQFFDIYRKDYWEILESERRNTPNTLFLIPINKAKEFLGELTYKGGCPVYGMYPLTIDQAREYVTEFVYKPLLGEDVFSRRVADMAYTLTNLNKNNVVLFNYNDYDTQAKPFIRKFGKQNVIIVESVEQL